MSLGSNVALFNYIVYVLLGPPYSLNKAFSSWIFIVMIVGIFSSSFIGRMVDRYGYPKILVMNIFIVIAGALFTINNMLAVKILGIALFTFGFSEGIRLPAAGWAGEPFTTKHRLHRCICSFITPVQVFSEQSEGYSGLVFTGWASSV